MALPKYYELYVPFLKAINDGKIHALKEIKEYITRYLCIEYYNLKSFRKTGKDSF